jgi:hypothetical protein
MLGPHLAVHPEGVEDVLLDALEGFGARQLGD